MCREEAFSLNFLFPETCLVRLIMAIPDTLLLGPGPCNISDSVRGALAQPLLGHLDPGFLEIMESTKSQLREVFKTKNKVTFPISATGIR